MVKYTSTVSSKLLVEGGFSSNLERYNNLYQPGIEQTYGSPAWLANARHCIDPASSGATETCASTNTAAGAEYGSYPDRYNMQASASYITGSNAIKFGFQDSWGPYNQTLRANADLYQNYVTNAQGIPTASTVTLLATPSHWQDRLNANLGLYAQDVMTFNRAPSPSAAIRVSTAGHGGTPRSALRQHPAFSDVQMPTWTIFSPRLGRADLMGDSKTAVSSATTGSASPRRRPCTRCMIRPQARHRRDRAVDRQERRGFAQGGNRCNFTSTRTAESICRRADQLRRRRWRTRPESDPP
jgi:hypothetical protein